MSIIVRSPTTWKDVPIGWDKNRVDVALAGDDIIKNIAPSVCAIVSSVGSGGTLEEAKHDLLPVTRRKYVEDLLERKANVVSGYLEKLAGEKSTENQMAIWEDEDAQTDIKRLESAIADLKTKAVDAATKELITKLEQDLETVRKGIRDRASRREKSQEIYDRYYKQLPLLPWMDLDNKTPQFDLRFNRQRSLANATGFTFARRYVMTAGHAIPSRNFTSERIFFNLHQEWNEGRVKDPEQDQCLGKIRADSSWAIKRVVLKEYHTTVPANNVPYHLQLDPKKPKPFPGVNYIWFHDAAILELQQPVSQRWAAKPLKIAASAAIAGEEVHALGHPTGLPLKYTSYSIKDNMGDSRPRVQQTPGPAAPDKVLATFSADIDTFKGNSGGPLLRKSNNEIIGIVKGRTLEESNLLFSSRPRPSTKHPLSIALAKWNADLCEELGINKPPSAFEEDRFIWDYEEMIFYPEIGPNGTFAQHQSKPNEPSNVPNYPLFNRVDYFAGFTGSLRNFLSTPKHAFQLQLVLTLKTGSVFPPDLTPFIKAGDGVYQCTFSGRLESASDPADETVSTYRWQINLNSTDDFKDRWSSVNAITSFLPTTMLEEESGLCALEEVHVELPYTPSKHENRIVSMTGRMEAIYVMEQGVLDQTPAPVNNAVLFEINFNMLPRDGNRMTKDWQGFLGQHIPTGSKDGVPAGALWKGPRVVSAPYIKKNSWSLQQTANEAAKDTWPGYPSLVGL